MKRAPKILITCGEESGDLHASRLAAEIRKTIPGASILALGGDHLARAGAEILHHVGDYAIMGFSGVIANFHRFASLERRLKKVLDDGVDLFIPVDYPGLNLRLATHARKSGVPVLYYIGPQIWAWGERRVHKLAKCVNRMAVILPFEQPIYEHHGIPAEFVGHPFVEDHSLPEPRSQDERSGVGLLPGSRVQEVQRILPILLRAATLIKATNPNKRFIIGRSMSVPVSTYQEIISRSGLDVDLVDDTIALMQNAELLLVASGTATLQSALLETPLIIVYRVSLLNYLIARRLVKIKNVGLVNILLEEEVCPEFIQRAATPERIAEEAGRILGSDGAREDMVGRFKELRERLTGGGGSRRVAEMSLQLINHT